MNSLIIVAGGQGIRFGSALPKQFLLLGGKPVILHAIEPFTTALKNPEIIVVLPAGHFRTWEKLVKKYNFNYSHTVVQGGQTRFHSVQNGIKAVKRNGIIAVHDSVRPFVTGEHIAECFRIAAEKGNAVPCISISESLRRINGQKSTVTERDKIKIIQTPQVFDTEILKKSYQTSYKKQFSDDATVAEAAGYHINLVEGLKQNIKITDGGDFRFAQWYYKSQILKK